jgi:formylmethanofuran dehydrogenase subunit C
VSALRFVQHTSPGQRLDLSPLTPDRLAGQDVASIERIALHTTRRRVCVGDIFRVENGEADDVLIEGGSSRFDLVGAGMTRGSLRVSGDVGQCAGRLMSGGTLHIAGSTGGWAGSGMRGGVLDVGGDAGDFLCGPLAGERTGMRGGIIVVRGNAALRPGDRLRRGTVIVEGDAGEHAGSAMVAGTLIVCGVAGAMPGVMMRRGTIVLGHADDLGPTFLPTANAELVFGLLLVRSVAPLSARAADCVAQAKRRLAGDLAVAGQGELFVPA